MVLELRQRGVPVQPQAPIIVRYHGQSVGEYYADLLVADAVIVELKAAKDLAPEHEAQLLNYLKATACEVGLLLNFGPEPQIKRKVYDNERKGGTMGHRFAQINTKAISVSRCLILMSDIAIRVENLSKLYHIGATQERHDTLRDAVTGFFRRARSRSHRRSRRRH